MTALAVVWMLTLLPPSAQAGDTNEGHYLASGHQVSIFAGKIRDARPASGRTRVHVLIVDVQSVVVGNVPRRAGVILDMLRYEQVPSSGSIIYVVSGSSKSPYTPALNGFAWDLESEVAASFVWTSSSAVRFLNETSAEKQHAILAEMIDHSVKFGRTRSVVDQLVHTTCMNRIRLESAGSACIEDIEKAVQELTSETVIEGKIESMEGLFATLDKGGYLNRIDLRRIDSKQLETVRIGDRITARIRPGIHSSIGLSISRL